MEEICTAVCNRIFESSKGGYEVFYEDELIEVLPEGLKTRETLEAALKKLTAEGCVDVKYARGNAFCVAAIKRFAPDIPAVEPAPVQPQPVVISVPKRAYVLVAACAFLGSLTSVIAAVFLGAVI